MTPLVVDDPQGRHRVASWEDLVRLASNRYDDATQLTVSRDGSEYPALDVSIVGEAAMVHYFPDEFEPGSVSVSNLDEPPGELRFLQHGTTERLSMPGSVAVDVRSALRCLAEFADNPAARPSAIEWVEL